MEIKLRFGECQNEDRLMVYKQDVQKSGVNILSNEIHENKGEGLISIDVKNENELEQFWSEFKKTSSSKFCF